MKLMQNYVLIKSLSYSDVSGGEGIILATNEQTKYGEVMAVGQGRITESGHLVPIDWLKVGDKVAYLNNSDTHIRVDGIPMLLINDFNIVMVL